MLTKPSKDVRRVFLIMGTPCVGKTSVAHMLASKLNALYIGLTELAIRENLVLGKDKQRNSIVVDEDKMRRKVDEIINNSSKEIIVIDGHYAASVVPERFVTYAFVLRRDPVELRVFMEKAGFSGGKLWENLAAEILDVCLFEAVKVYGVGRVCEVNVTGKSVEDVVREILDVVDGRVACRVGVVDWLGKLESEGLLDEYLRI